VINTRTIAFTIATRFRETVGLGFTLCSLARVTRRDRCHLGIPPTRTSIHRKTMRVQLAPRAPKSIIRTHEQSLHNFSRRIKIALAADKTSHNQVSTLEAQRTDAHCKHHSPPLGKLLGSIRNTRPPTVSTLKEVTRIIPQLPRLTSQESRRAVDGR